MTFPTLQDDTRTILTDADRLAADCWRKNVDAIANAQPRLADDLRDVRPTVTEWVFARDGVLTALVDGGRWLAGCSLPRRAAEAMLRTLDVGGVVACLLDAPHAAHVRATLDKLRPTQAVVSLHPNLSLLALLLHCDDFSTDLAAGRLWFAWGEAWPRQLEALFAERPGLPVPSNFVRLPTSPQETVDSLVSTAQAVFNAESARRAVAVRATRERAASVAPSPRRLVVIAPSRFRLWDDAGAILAETFDAAAPAGVGWNRLDTDVPTSASPLALAAMAEGCDAVVAADVARADAGHVLPEALPWITWVTAGRIPPVTAAGRRDGLLVADPAWVGLAAAAGWPADRVAVAAWPAWPAAPRPAAGPATVAIVADTRPVAPHRRLDDYSSHRLLWESIAEELARDPFAGLDDADAFLAQRVRCAAIDEAGIDRRLFLDKLMAPARLQGLARLLLRHSLPLRLHGQGWADLDEFEPHAAGPVASRAALQDAVASAAVLIHPSHAPHAHPIDSAGRPAVRATRGGERPFLAAVRQALVEGHPARPDRPAPAAISADVVIALASRLGKMGNF